MNDEPETDGNDTMEQPDESSQAEVDVREPEFQELTNSAADGAVAADFNRLQDIKISVSAELGKAVVPIQELLQLGPGSVLELDRTIDSPVELVTQGVPLAKGEVVVVNGFFAIRILEVYPNFQQKQAG